MEYIRNRKTVQKRERNTSETPTDTETEKPKVFGKTEKPIYRKTGNPNSRLPPQNGYIHSWYLPEEGWFKASRIITLKFVLQQTY